MKKSILLFAGIILMLGAKAQFPMGGPAKKMVTGRITAIILDSASKKPIDYATVSLIKSKDNKSVNGAVTDERGKVTLANVSPEEYKLSIGFMGYKTKVMVVKTTPEKPDLNAGTIYLSATAGNLKEVEISGQKALIENKVDKLVYNAEQDITNAGGDATDVMRKVPMLSVDVNGNLQMRGSSVRVLINGKPSGTMANSVADALKMIPAEQIKSVEVITSPSAKYDAEGSGGIVNIITKKKSAEGTSGSVNTSVGTRSNNGAFNLNAKTGRLSLTGSLGVNHAYPQNSKVVSSNMVALQTGGGTSLEQNGFSDWSRVGYNGSAGIDYDFNNYHNISTNLKINRFSNGGPGTTTSKVNGNLGSVITRDMDMGFNNLDWSVDYRKTSKKEGEEFSISAQLSTGRNTSDYSNKTVIQELPVEVFDSNTGKNNEYTVQTDYVYPFSKTTTLETGVKGIFRNIISTYSDVNQDFDYDQNVGAAYGVLGFKLTKKITAKAGLRAEYTKINWLSSTKVPFGNDYFNLFPSLILSQSLKGASTIKVSYNRRIQRPSLFYLNPFENKSDQFSILKGNPGLNPELSDNIEMGYSTFIKGSVINASVFYRSTKDVIESIITPLPVAPGAPQAFLTSYTNVGRSESYGMNIFGSYNPKPKWTLMANIGLNTYNVNNNSSTNAVNTGTFLNYTAFARSAYAFPGGWNSEIWGVINSPRRTFQGKTDAMYFYGGALKKEIWKKKATIGLNVLNPFSRDLVINTVNKGKNAQGDTYEQKTNIHYPLRSFGINLSYNFGKLKFTQPKKGVKNDDLKKEDQGGMGGVQN